MDDSISRQGAIKELRALAIALYGYDATSIISCAIYKLQNLPSAQPEQRWIPCSEQLPKENGDYLVTGRKGAVNKRKYEDGRWYGNWAIVAWMPLPKPWKGEV